MSFVTSLYQKKQKNEMLPPTFNSLLQHLKQSNYQAIVWRHAFEAMQDLEPPEGHGWVRDEELFASLLVIKAPEPEILFELTASKCKTSACLKICCCTSRGLGCTEGCHCMADDEACKNPHVLTFISDSEEEWRANNLMLRGNFFLRESFFVEQQSRLESRTYNLTSLSCSLALTTLRAMYKAISSTKIEFLASWGSRARSRDLSLHSLSMTGLCVVKG